MIPRRDVQACIAALEDHRQAIFADDDLSDAWVDREAALVRLLARAEPTAMDGVIGKLRVLRGNLAAHYLADGYRGPTLDVALLDSAIRDLGTLPKPA